MRVRHLVSILGMLISGLFTSSGCDAPAVQADVVLLNAKIWTVDPNLPQAEIWSCFPGIS